MYAVRTPSGIQRRLRRYDGEGEPNRLVRLADAEYDPRYDLAIAAGCGLVGVAALVAVGLVAEDAFVARWLLALALFGNIGALGAIGSYSLR